MLKVPVAGAQGTAPVNLKSSIRLDPATLVGLIGGFAAMIVSFTMEGGEVSGLVNSSAALIVFGGTICAAVLASPLGVVLNLPRVIAKSVASRVVDEVSLINLLASLAETARRDGLLSLEARSASINDQFLKRGIRLVVDGAEPETVREVLDLELEQMLNRHELNYGVLEAMGGFSPTMGIIGTVMGLVHVLGSLADPSNWPGDLRCLHRHFVRRRHRGPDLAAARLEAPQAKRARGGGPQSDGTGASEHPGRREPTRGPREVDGLPAAGQAHIAPGEAGEQGQDQGGSSLMSFGKHRRSSGHGNSERWLLTYADLITLLLAFFVLMYGISTSDLAKFRRLALSMRQVFNPGAITGELSKPAVDGPPTDFAGGALSEDLSFIRAEIETFVTTEGMEGSVEVALRPEGIAIVISDAAIFASGRAELGERAIPVLNKVAQLLTSVPNEVRVEGHTDDLPTDGTGYPTNWSLSAARAVSVTRYLTEVAGIDPARVCAAAFGEFRPVAPNDTPEGRGKNRRAEILIIYPNY